MTSRAFDLMHGYAAIREAIVSGIRKELAAGVGRTAPACLSVISVRWRNFRSWHKVDDVCKCPSLVKITH